MKEIDPSELAVTHAIIWEWLSLKDVHCPKNLLVDYCTKLFGIPESVASNVADHLSSAFDHLKEGNLGRFEATLWASYVCIYVSPVHERIPKEHQIETNEAAKLERESWELLISSKGNPERRAIAEKCAALYGTLLGIDPNKLLWAGKCMANALCEYNSLTGIDDPHWKTVRVYLTSFYQELGTAMASASLATPDSPA